MNFTSSEQYKSRTMLIGIIKYFDDVFMVTKCSHANVTAS